MKTIYIISILCLTHLFSCAQGLENIIVEIYYITDQNNSRQMEKMELPAGLITYRIYVDMKPGYNLQSVYGSPGHEMKLSTNTYFYNHPVHGSYISNLIFDRYLGETTVILDSWISMGGGSQETYAVLKTDDDTLMTVVNGNSPKVLHSENHNAGIPLKVKDGLTGINGMPPRITQVGMDSLLLSMDKKCTSGEGFSFTTSNGGWGCLGGARGADPKTNMVCIGQFSTTGDFNFEFNIQIGSPENGIEQYVARNPSGSEQLHPELIIQIPSSNQEK